MTTTASTISRPRYPVRRPVWRTGAAAAIGAAAVLFGYGALAEALGVPMKAADPGAHVAQTITPANFAVGTLVCSFWGIVLAALIARRAVRPARVWWRTTGVLLIASLAFPLTAPHAATSTQFTLALGHLLAAAIVVPLIARRLSEITRHAD